MNCLVLDKTMKQGLMKEQVKEDRFLIQRAILPTLAAKLKEIDPIPPFWSDGGSVRTRYYLRVNLNSCSYKYS